MTTFKIDSRLRDISAKAFMDETELLRELADSCPRYEKLLPAIQANATKLVEKLRKEGAGHGVEAFLAQYGLNTQEGVAIMCLAEALLRIPDDHTADELIRDKFEGRAWDSHLGKSESILVNASSWGLVLTGKLVEYSEESDDKPSNLLKKLVGRVGEPTVRESIKQAVKYIGTQFVMGTRITEAMKRARPAQKKGYSLSYDILGEGARTQKQADAYYDAYLGAIQALAKSRAPIKPSLSIKLSALHPKYYLAKRKRLEKELLPKLKNLTAEAQKAGLMVSIDAEESYRLDLHMMLFRALREDPAFKGYDGLGFVLQAYGKRAYDIIDWLKRLSDRCGQRIPVRLVKGAYWDTEIKLAQVNGLEGYPVFTRKSNTDLSYIACAEKMLEHKECFYPQFATHNALSLAAIREIANDIGWKQGEYEFQRLHGMGEKLYDQLIGDVPCRIYAPVGEHKDLLAYLIRRLLENGANSSFVNQLMDETLPVAIVLKDPLELVRSRGFNEHPEIPLPADIYSDRKNSTGYDMGNLAHEATVLEMLAAHSPLAGEGAVSDECSVLNVNNQSNTQHSALNTQHPVTNPATGAVIGHITHAMAEEIDPIMRNAVKVQKKWNQVPLGERAAILESAADLFETHYGELLAITVQEAGKTLTDAIAEVREAIDFLRYYAVQARTVMVPRMMEGPTGESNELQLHGRGVFVCISPWNFPLAIFVGQVAAALVAGNGVLAKPAEQTPLIAQKAVSLLHEAGIPESILQLVVGSGRSVGQALVEHPAIAGVCFTGSVPVAKHINQTLAAKDGPIVPLIAETGGQNCMIVDSTALLEAAVDDILLSAFGSAGQRCSALRVLYVQDEIADELIEMIHHAMQELKPGNPTAIDTDIGPVIDTRAQSALQTHIEAMKDEAKLVATANPLTSHSPLAGESESAQRDRVGGNTKHKAQSTSTPPTESANASSTPPQGGSDTGTFLPPHAFEISDITQLTQEHFGPILHIIRFKGEELEQLPERINATGFGLTFGLHSRIEDHWEWMAEQVNVGNCYINRNMTGAVVGVQPFGGEGLSGTGPKAGGPHYLLRFVSERTVTINTAAIGGNLELLS